MLVTGALHLKGHVFIIPTIEVYFLSLMNNVVLLQTSFDPLVPLD